MSTKETTKPTGPLTYVAPSGNDVFLGSYIRSVVTGGFTMSTDPTKPTTKKTAEARSPNPGSAEWWASLPPADRERRLTAFHEAMKTIMGRWDHLDRSKDASNG